MARPVLVRRRRRDVDARAPHRGRRRALRRCLRRAGRAGSRVARPPEDSGRAAHRRGRHHRTRRARSRMEQEDESCDATAPRARRARQMEHLELVARLAATRIGATFNQYAESELCRRRLAAHLAERESVDTILVGEAAGYRGARVSGLAFTSERQLTGTGAAEASATIVHRVLAELGLEDAVLLWNVVPTHPGTSTSNRRPTQAEIEAARPFLAEA